MGGWRKGERDRKRKRKKERERVIGKENYLPFTG